ncbi:hypothetical protein J2P12_02475 [Candidatus Bathyarchaeota archaeon]|nr:hypothetical protein [Candidatus Bathyarchaeota archaeon]
MPALMSRIGQGQGGGTLPGGGPPSSAPGSPGINPEAIGAAVSQEYSQLQNVDPGKIVADLQRYKQAISAIFPVAVNRVADAAKGISQAVTGLNSAIKAFEKAQETLKSVHPPLGISAAQQQPPTGATPFGPQGMPPGV